MKHIPNIVGGLLGFAFIAFGLMFLLNMMPKVEGPPAGSPPALMMEAMAPTGYLTMVKVLEVVGGLLVAIPKLRNIGLLVLGPILINILAFNVFLAKGVGLFAPPIVPILCAMALYLLWVGRRAFAGLIR